MFFYSHHKIDNSLATSSGVGKIYVKLGSFYISDFLTEILTRFKELRRPS